MISYTLFTRNKKRESISRISFKNACIDTITCIWATYESWLWVQSQCVKWWGAANLSFFSKWVETHNSKTCWEELNSDNCKMNKIAQNKYCASSPLEKKSLMISLSLFMGKTNEYKEAAAPYFKLCLDRTAMHLYYRGSNNRRRNDVC